MTTLAIQNVDFENVEIIVVDNRDEIYHGNVKNTIEKIDSRIRYLNYKHDGLTGARHAGLKISSGEIISYIDDDVIVPSTWISSVIEIFKNDEIVLAGGPSLPIFTSTIPKWIFQFFDPTPYGGFHMPTLSLVDLGIDRGYVDPAYIWGLNFSIRRSMLIKTGGFHPDLMPENMKQYEGDGEIGVTSAVKEMNYLAYWDRALLVFHNCPSSRLTQTYFLDRAKYEARGKAYSNFRKLGYPSFQNGLIFLVLKFSHSLSDLFFSKYLKDRFMRHRIILSTSYHYYKQMKLIKSNLHLREFFLKERYLEFDE